MSQDVELIEEERQIIEISDDDNICILEEVSDQETRVPAAPNISNCSSVKVENNCVNLEIIEEERQIIEISDDDNICILGEVSDQETHVPTAPNRYYCSSVKVENKCVHLVDETIQPITNSNGSSNVAFNIQHTPSLQSSIIKRRKRRRHYRLRKKSAQNNHTAEALTEREPNISNNTKQNNPIQEKPTFSSNSSTSASRTEKPPDYYDYSKLQWLKPLNTILSPPGLQIVIIDRSHPFWRIDTDKWLMVEKRLLEALNSEMLHSNDRSIGLFDGAKWQRGIKIVGCHNENAFNFIMKFIINLDNLWGGAKLEAFPISNINHHIIKVYIPPPTLQTELCMSLIKLQNPSISTKDWKVIKERERPNNNGVDIWIRVNAEAFTQLDKVGGEIKYGINRVWAKPSD